jgi:MoaA/NifB/PqqE/SkfB family radical SAM enzyme/glycosyltransferase involved in cell wall biosynthesis
VHICIVTRGDLYPTNHGAAVKIVRTAEYLSLLGSTVLVVTEDRDVYLRYKAGHVERVPYGDRFRAAQEWPGMDRAARLAERICGRIGYPREEYFLYTPQFDPAWWARVLYVGRREQIDVFQAEFPGYGVPCWLAAKLLGRRSSIVQHNVEWDRLQDVMGLGDHEVRRIKACELFALERVDEVIAVSRDDRDRMVAAGLSGERITVIPHGVDTLSYADPRGAQVRFSYGLPTDAPLLFFHGTLHYWPNTQAVRFIAEELLPLLLASQPELRVIISGLNPPTYYAHPAITFTGPVADLPGHIAAADLTLCPVPSGGGTRMKILEYFAAGKACVATAKGAEGITFTPGREIALAEDARSLADEVLRLLGDREAREAMGSAARRFASFYDWTPIAQRYLDLYQGQGRGGDYNTEVTEALAANGQPPAALALPVAAGTGIEGHLPLRDPSKPLTLLLLINRGCNLTCSFCDLWDNPAQMSLEQSVALLDEAAAIGTQTLVITGGEPFIHKQLFDVVAAGKARGMGVNITTNGTLVKRRWQDLIASGVDSLSMSIDGLSATHDRLRGQKGCHDRTWKALERVKAHGGIGLSVYFTVNRENVGELTQVFDRARALGVGFDFWPVNDAKDLYLVSESDRETFRQAVAYIAERDPEVARQRHFYEQGMAYHSGESGPVRCLGLVDQYGVTFEGDLLPCCVWGGDGLKVGNVFETPLSELWLHEDVQSHRKRLYSEGCRVGCFNHSLYEFTRSTGESFRVGLDAESITL